MKTVIKLLLLFFAFLILLILLYLLDDKDFCLDTGVCKEGLGINTEKGYIVINEETCKENDGIWDSKHRRCKFKQK